jgi:hypothetical protein
MRLLLPVIALLFSGCAQVNAMAPPPLSSDILFGAVRLVVPATRGKLVALDVTTIGAGAGDSAFIGYRRGQYVYVEPTDCRLLLIIRSKVDTAHAEQILGSLEGEDVCFADFGGSLPQP